MALTNLLSQITRNLDDLQEILEYKKEHFESKFSYLKEQISNFEGKVQQYQQKEREIENLIAEETESEYESGSEDLQEELEDTKRKLKHEETKNKELNQDVDDLNGLVGLYVQEAQRREKLEEEWQKTVTIKLKTRIRGLEDEILRKIGETNNLENIIVELRSELNCRDEIILDKDKEIRRLHEKVAKMQLIQNVHINKGHVKLQKEEE